MCTVCVTIPVCWTVCAGYLGILLGGLLMRSSLALFGLRASATAAAYGDVDESDKVMTSVLQS
jgi:hypothetical protein